MDARVEEKIDNTTDSHATVEFALDFLYAANKDRSFTVDYVEERLDFTISDAITAIQSAVTICFTVLMALFPIRYVAEERRLFVLTARKTQNNNLNMKTKLNDQPIDSSTDIQIAAIR